ncbi:MAG: hypothetical protein IK130_01265 [Oscillospiraceae bacterium]|nr:hypothetical protein [Oscillospiraceae bacterium]
MTAIEEQLQYWYDYDYNNKSAKYRQTYDRDCHLTDGNLYADTMLSLWTPLRCVLNACGSERWQKYTQKERTKTNKVLIRELQTNLTQFIPNERYLERLNLLFRLGRTRANVMILPYRFWNTARGGFPYCDYLPHFLYELLAPDQPLFLRAAQNWIRREHLEMFFDNKKTLTRPHLRNLAGTQNVLSHHLSKVNTPLLLENYIDILQRRRRYYK